MIKLTGLSRANVRAIEECWPNWIENGTIETTTTTATFHCDDAAGWAKQVEWKIGTLPMRGHPKASLHAVRRRLLAHTS